MVIFRRRSPVLVEGSIVVVAGCLQVHGFAPEIGAAVPHVIVHASTTASNEANNAISDILRFTDTMSMSIEIVPARPVFRPESGLVGVRLEVMIEIGMTVKAIDCLDSALGRAKTHD